MAITMKASMSKDINKDQGFSLVENKAGNMMVSGKMDK